jgi:hypothetical protein
MEREEGYPTQLSFKKGQELSIVAFGPKWWMARDSDGNAGGEQIFAFRVSPL